MPPKGSKKVGKAIMKGAKKLTGKVRKGKAKPKTNGKRLLKPAVMPSHEELMREKKLDYANFGKSEYAKKEMEKLRKRKPKTGGQRMREQKGEELRKTRKKPSGRAKKTQAHVDNVRGATVRRARAAAHFPIDQEDVRIRRLRHQNSTHEKARQEKPHVTISSGNHRVRNPMATFFNEFDPAVLAGPSGGGVHRKGRSRFGKNSMASAANELNPAIRGGGGSDVARGPYGKISGLA